MSFNQDSVEIIDAKTGSPVTANLHTELAESDVFDVEIEWGPERLRALKELRQRGVTQLPEHVHWNWAMKAMKRSGLIAYRTFGVEAKSRMQGLMVVILTGKVSRLDPDKGKALVYVEYIETAPWNAKEFTAFPTFKGVGIRLVQAAVRLSIDEGFSGRVGLHSLPQSKPFYTSVCEMQALGPDPSFQDLEYFELTAAKAAELLKK